MVEKLRRESTRSETNQAEGTISRLEQSKVAEQAELQERQRRWWKPSLTQSHRQTHEHRQKENTQFS